jgi:hypothetical protein
LTGWQCRFFYAAFLVWWRDTRCQCIQGSSPLRHTLLAGIIGVESPSPRVIALFDFLMPVSMSSSFRSHASFVANFVLLHATYLNKLDLSMLDSVVLPPITESTLFALVRGGSSIRFGMPTDNRRGSECCSLDVRGSRGHRSYYHMKQCSGSTNGLTSEARLSMREKHLGPGSRPI